MPVELADIGAWMDAVEEVLTAVQVPVSEPEFMVPDMWVLSEKVPV